MATVNNPFDLNVKTPATLMGTAQTATAAPSATGYSTQDASATGFTGATANATGYNAKQTDLGGYDASQATGTNWDVANNQTVQGQLTGLIAANSPLLQQARAKSLAEMNARGLANSSMAVGAGQEAVIKQALPIAQADATMFGSAGKYNADVGNQTSQFNVGQTNTAQQFTAGAENQGLLANQAAINTAEQQRAAATNQASLANQASINQANQFTASAKNAAELTNTAAENRAAEFGATATNEASKLYSQSLNASVTKMMDLGMQTALANADAQTKVDLQNIDAATRRDLAATEALYKNQMQASASANETFQQVSKNISDIMANPDLDTTAKQAAVDKQKAALKDSLSILSATSGIKLSNGASLSTLLTFG